MIPLYRLSRSLDILTASTIAAIKRKDYRVARELLQIQSDCIKRIEAIALKDLRKQPPHFNNGGMSKLTNPLWESGEKN